MPCFCVHVYRYMLNSFLHLLQDVTPENFIAALSGKDGIVKGVGTGRVIKRLVYFITSFQFVQKNI